MLSNNSWIGFNVHSGEAPNEDTLRMFPLRNIFYMPATDKLRPTPQADERSTLLLLRLLRGSDWVEWTGTD